MAETHEVTAPDSSGTADEPLSIGEVLAVLAEEFPDVTISKIRFLESQGLVEPERNASGYRQFRDADIERLRWILRQQRDHFLPLKVIRRALERGVDVIDAGAGDQPTLWTAVAEAAAAEEVERRRAETVESEAADARRSAAVSSAHPTRARVATPVGSGSVRRRRRDGDDGARYETPADVVAALQEAPQGLDDSAPAAEESEGSPSDTESDTRAGTDPSRDATDEGAPAAADGAHDTPAPHGEDEATDGASGADSAAEPAGDDEPGTASRGPGAPRGGPEAGAGDAGTDTEGAMVQLSRDELMEQVGLDPDTLDQLTEFGLLDPLDVAGEALYGARDLEIARLAKRGGELGLTPRHLRIYKVAADREAGLLEQVAMPLLKQRNPAARERAASTVAELADLGASLHAALLAEELGPNLAP